jgi:hypothetical protein
MKRPESLNGSRRFVVEPPFEGEGLRAFPFLCSTFVPVHPAVLLTAVDSERVAAPINLVAFFRPVIARFRECKSDSRD